MFQCSDDQFHKTTPIFDLNCRKKAHLGHYKKSFFRAPQKSTVFLQFLKTGVPILVLANEYGHFVEIVFFFFC